MGDQEMKFGKLDLSHLTQRERWFLLGGGVFAFVLLLYLGVWSPLSNALDILKQSNATQRALNHWVETTLTQIQQFRARGISVQEIKKENLLSVLEDLLSREQLNIYMDSIQEREGKIVISFKEIPFDRLMAWLEKIWRSYGVKVSQINVVREAVQGMVRVNLLLER